MSLSPEQLAKPLRVARRIQETADAVSLVFEIPENLKSQFHYQAGQFVTFFLTVDGQKLNRSYSLSSSPLTDKDFKITVKKVAGGVGSTFLCERVKEGDTLLTTPPAGHFFKPSLDSGGVHYYLFAAGSGVTPVYSILKTVLTASPLNRVTLVYCNRNEDSIIYKNELAAWLLQKPQQLKIVDVLSRPSSAWAGRAGRLQADVIVPLLKSDTPQTREFYMCGPKEFMQLIRGTLTSQGVAGEFIHEEDFGLAVHKPHMEFQEGWTFIGPSTEMSSPEKIIATISGETIEVDAKPGQSVLETLLEAGAQPPYSCMDGACMACLAKVTEGRVYQEDPGILADDNVQNCETLSCQAKPASRIVKVSYDNL
jgi:ring-1,2-phenylacetyl-CoA epoxidase subunit PaaE